MIDKSIAINWPSLVWHPLIKALNNFCALDDLNDNPSWCEQVGAAQLILPAHIVNTYLSSKRNYEKYETAIDWLTGLSTGLAWLKNDYSCNLKLSDGHEFGVDITTRDENMMDFHAADDLREMKLILHDSKKQIQAFIHSFAAPQNHSKQGEIQKGVFVPS